MSTTITVDTTVITPTLVEGYEVTRTSQNVVHTILGKPDPDVSLRPAGMRSGTLELLFNTEADAWTAHDALCSGEVCALASTDLGGIDMAFVVTEDATITLDDDTRKVWHVEFGFQEVAV